MHFGQQAQPFQFHKISAQRIVRHIQFLTQSGHIDAIVPAYPFDNISMPFFFQHNPAFKGIYFRKYMYI